MVRKNKLYSHILRLFNLMMFLNAAVSFAQNIATNKNVMNDRQQSMPIVSNKLNGMVGETFLSNSSRDYCWMQKEPYYFRAHTKAYEKWVSQGYFSPYTYFREYVKIDLKSNKQVKSISYDSNIVKDYGFQPYEGFVVLSDDELMIAQEMKYKDSRPIKSEILVFDCHSGDLLTTIKTKSTNPIQNLLFSEDGSVLIVLTRQYDKVEVKYWNVNTGKLLKKMQYNHWENIEILKFSRKDTDFSFKNKFMANHYRFTKDAGYDNDYIEIRRVEVNSLNSELIKIVYPRNSDSIYEHRFLPGSEWYFFAEKNQNLKYFNLVNCETGIVRRDSFIKPEYLRHYEIEQFLLLENKMYVCLIKFMKNSSGGYDKANLLFYDLNLKKVVAKSILDIPIQETNYGSFNFNYFWNNKTIIYFYKDCNIYKFKEFKVEPKQNYVQDEIDVYNKSMNKGYSNGFTPFGGWEFRFFSNEQKNYDEVKEYAKINNLSICGENYFRILDGNFIFGRNKTIWLRDESISNVNNSYNGRDGVRRYNYDLARIVDLKNKSFDWDYKYNAHNYILYRNIGINWDYIINNLDKRVKIGRLEVLIPEIFNVSFLDANALVLRLSDNWRLPTIEELKVIYDNRSILNLDLRAFELFELNYWSSTIRSLESVPNSGPYLTTTDIKFDYNAYTRLSYESYLKFNNKFDALGFNFLTGKQTVTYNFEDKIIGRAIFVRGGI